MRKRELVGDRHMTVVYFVRVLPTRPSPSLEPLSTVPAVGRLSTDNGPVVWCGASTRKGNDGRGVVTGWRMEEWKKINISEAGLIIEICVELAWLKECNNQQLN